MTPRRTPAQRAWWQKYHRYLASAVWARKRHAVRRRSGGICERCRSRPASQCHHRTYERVFRERLTDLEDLCLVCHQAEHPQKRLRPPCPPALRRRRRPRRKPER